MDRAALSEFLCSTIALACNADANSISPATKMMDLNIDSLTFVSILAQVEAVFEIEILPDDIIDLLEADCVDDVLASIASMTGRR